MAEKKREAEAAVDLMSVQYERNCSEEERRNGLIILQAFYGKIPEDFNPNGWYLSDKILLNISKILFYYPNRWPRCECYRC